jgi:hypothetical protein
VGTTRTRGPGSTALSALAASALTALALSGGVSAGSAALPRPTTPPRITGDALVGATLTAEPGTWSGSQPIRFSYQWFRCSSTLANCRSIAGATSRRFTLGSVDRGHRMLVNVTATNGDGSRSAQASTVVVRSAARPRNTSLPTIAGVTREGQTLTAGPGGWTGTQPVRFSYQWQRCDRSGGSCSNIIGATNQTYVLTTADVGKTLRVNVTARNAAGSASRRSAATNPIEAAPPPGPAGQIKLPNGKTSIPITSVSLPNRLVIDAVKFTPNPVRSRRTILRVSVHVSDTRGFVVRDALVFVRSTPLVTVTPPELATRLDGWVILATRARVGIRGITFPLQRGLNVQFYVQARKAGEKLLYGVTATRLTQVRTAR